MMWRGVAAVLSVLLLGAGPLGAQDEEAPAHARRARPAAAGRATGGLAAEDRALLRQIAEAQRALGEQLQALKERVDALSSALAARNDDNASLAQEVKSLRDEVKGLYVESSAVRQQIDGVKEDVHGVDANVSGFRTFSGFFIAAMVLLLAVIFVLTIRR
jgi:septal ring factor EnvC (AmiA/AmiB activator)